MDIDYSKKIGKGQKGTVYLTNKKNVVVKIIDKSNYQKNEYLYSKKAGELRIGPKIYKKIKKDDKIFIYMQKVDIILKDWLLKKHSEETYNEAYIKIVKLLKKLHKNNIIHGDIQMGNIAKIKNRWVLIDYGDSHKASNSQFSIKDIKSFLYKPLYSNKGYKKYLERILIPYPKLDFFIKLHMFLININI
jgi:tRNA A-37 threonylcarbamoyl transferase component Bud32